MAQANRVLNVLISSKQSEFAAERADIASIMRPVPLLSAITAEDWAPERMAIQHKSVVEAANCSIYVGLFGCIYSEATALECEAAATNQYREMMIYVRDCQDRDPKLAAFLNKTFDPVQGRTVVIYSDWAAVRDRFTEHLWAAVARMIEHLLRLGNPPTPMGPAGQGSILERRWTQQKKALTDLGLPADAPAAAELADTLTTQLKRLTTNRAIPI